VKNVQFDAYVIETLMGDLVGHDRSPAAFIVYLYLYARAAGTRHRSVKVSHQGIAADTGLSKSAVQSAVRRLVQRKLLRSARATPTSTPEHFVLRPWKR
jgi:CRP-like cAMP-binding protein